MTDPDQSDVLPGLLPGLLLGSSRTPPERTLIDILRETVRAFPEASALQDEDGALSYRELAARVREGAVALGEAGVVRGDRVGVRMPSGDRFLYLAILSVLAAGAAYVPVDADDPEERAALVFGEAGVVGIVGVRGVFEPQPGSELRAARLFAATPPHPGATFDLPAQAPTPDDDAWIIFTSGSTGTPKGVAASHRSAAAFADAESGLFLRAEGVDPLGPGDRVLAGLSVAFDASCEEMWLAWRSGACLVPAPRSLVRTGADLGPWLVLHDITVVSTVPTLAGLWPSEALDSVRLLIFGGEALPPELVDRVATDGREVWNTYGPTEATVVTTGSLVTPGETVRIGLPLDGWDAAVVDADGQPVADGEVGELIIGGVGLARYLDPAKDAEKYAPHAGLGWDRAYRSGDLVRFEREGLVFQGRADDQVKVGGRRIELGEIEAALSGLPGVGGAAAAVRTTDAGNHVIVGYLAVGEADQFDRSAALARLRVELPAALVPLLALVEGDLPTKTSGKIDRDALPWPLPSTSVGSDDAGMSPDELVLAADWQAVLGLPIDDAAANFFDLGGGSLAAAQLVARIRARDPEFTVAEIYSHPRLGAMADALALRVGTTEAPRDDYHRSKPTPLRMQWLQTLLGVPLHVLSGIRWLTYALTASTVLRWSTGFDALPSVNGWLLVALLVVFVTPFGRMAISVVASRILLAGVEAGDHPRGGGVHLRLWLAEQIAHQIGAVSLAGAPWISYYARALGARIAPDVDLHALPPVTGMLRIGRGASIEPEVDLSGYWIDGDVVRIGAIRIGAGSTVGMRSTLLPGTKIGKNASVAPGSAVFGRVPSGQEWAGSPAARVGKNRTWWAVDRPRPARRWLVAYGFSATVLALLPLISLAGGGALLATGIQDSASLTDAFWRGLALLVPATLVSGLIAALLVVAFVRLLGLGVTEGTFPVRSRVGWQVWSTERLLDLSRAFLFPLYSSLFTPVWLRMLGAKVGHDVEASTVLLLPVMTTIRDGAFLADDTLVASYELGGGYLRVAQAEIGQRAFLGNSGMTGPGHKVPRDGLVAVLSAAPRKSKAGSSWLGSPAVRLRRTVAVTDEARTFRPPARIRAARILWELGRIVPVIVTCLVGYAAVFALLGLVALVGVGWTLLLSGPLMLVVGLVAATLATVAKWALVGRIRATEKPLWSSFVWRSEVADVFVEMCAAPWFAQAAMGTPALVWWLRSLGASIGRGVWTDSYWLPEADLVRLGDGSTVNRGCVVQTHLFHDRIMSMDTVTLDAGATLGPHSVVLPAATIGQHATVGPASLVMRGEGVPTGSRWSGNPIGPWREVRLADYHAAGSGAGSGTGSGGGAGSGPAASQATA